MKIFVVESFNSIGIVEYTGIDSVQKKSTELGQLPVKAVAIADFLKTLTESGHVFEGNVYMPYSPIEGVLANSTDNDLSDDEDFCEEDFCDDFVVDYFDDLLKSSSEGVELILLTFYDMESLDRYYGSSNTSKRYYLSYIKKMYDYLYKLATDANYGFSTDNKFSAKVVYMLVANDRRLFFSDPIDVHEEDAQSRISKLTSTSIVDNDDEVMFI